VARYLHIERLMVNFNEELSRLHQNLAVLQERAAKYGADNAPLELVNQLADHHEAIALTEQARQGDLTEAAWREKLRTLLVDIGRRDGGGAAGRGDIGNVTGDIIGAIMAGGNITAGGDIVTGVKGSQTAQGQGIAQVMGSGRATVNYYQLAAPAPIDPATLAAAHRRLAALPLDAIPPVATLPPGSRLPYPPNPHFVGRADELRELARRLKGGQTAVIGQIAAATGLGGIGKSQLAVALAHHYGTYFSGGVFWLSMAEPEGVATEVAACGPPGSEGLEFESRVRRVLSDWQSDLPRLLIFDNCEAEALLIQWRPPTGQSRVLLTSRCQSWSETLGVQPLALPTLPRPHSVELLRKFRPALSDPEAGAIAAALGDLPLALHLAGSFLARYGRVTPAAYLAELQAANPLTHPALEGRGAAYSPTGHALHVARTFAVSWNRLAPADPTDALARRLLARAACFAPGEPIPQPLLLATLDPEPDPPHSPFTIDDALHRLLGLGLLTAAETGSVTLHRLLADFVQHAAPDPSARPAVEEAVLREASRLNETGFPGPLLAWQPHLRHLTDAAVRREDETAAKLCNSLGYHLHQIGDYAGALPYFQRALAIREKVLGPEHPATATSLNNLGLLLKTQGDYAGALPYYRRALDIREKVLGPEHPDTAASLNNLAELLRTTGDYAGALPYYRRALTICEKVLGPEHPDTAASLNNLAVLCFYQGDYPAAAGYMRRALDIREQKLGPNHPDTQSSRRSLQVILGELGGGGEAPQP
jgi:tetratricopeptide (TPR) repeat protein